MALLSSGSSPGSLMLATPCTFRGMPPLEYAPFTSMSMAMFDSSTLSTTSNSGTRSARPPRATR